MAQKGTQPQAPTIKPGPLNINYGHDAERIYMTFSQGGQIIMANYMTLEECEGMIECLAKARDSFKAQPQRKPS